MYLLANGAALAVAPSLPLTLLGLPPAEDRGFGCSVSLRVIGFYFLFAARKGSPAFPPRSSAEALHLWFFWHWLHSKLGPVQLLLFAAVDLLHSNLDSSPSEATAA